MCIAIAKPAGLAITKSILKQCFDSNPDGAGFCVELDGKLEIHKGYFSFEDFYTAFLPYENLKALIHFRIMTHGTLDENNCHPFFVDSNTAFIHNGIINSVPMHKEKSDTLIFNELYLQPLLTKFGESVFSLSSINNLISKFVEASKLVFMTAGQNDFVFINKELGNESKEGIWFSNFSWQPRSTDISPSTRNPFLHNWKTKTLNHPLPKTIEKSELPFLEIGNNTFSFGTTIQVKWPINHEFGTIPKGALGEIEAVYSNKTVDIDFLVEGKVTGLYPYALEVISNFSENTWEDSLVLLHERNL